MWLFSISDAREGQRVKTSAGIRKVPISSKLGCARLPGVRRIPQGARHILQMLHAPPNFIFSQAP